MTQMRPSVMFKMTDKIVYDLRPTLEVIGFVEERFGSLIKLAERMEQRDFGVSELKDLVMVMLSPFKVPEKEVDEALLTYGALNFLLPVAKFMKLALLGCAELEDGMKPVLAPK